MAALQLEGKGKMENEIGRKNGLPVAGPTFSVYAEGNATAVGLHGFHKHYAECNLRGR